MGVTFQDRVGQSQSPQEYIISGSKCFLIVLIILVQVTMAPAQWVQTNGPQGGTVNCFAVNGTNPKSIALALIDVARARAVDLRTQGTYKLEPASVITVLQVAIGRPDLVKKITDGSDHETTRCSRTTRISSTPRRQSPC